MGLMIFMVTFVVPEFETVYHGSGVALPMVTMVVTGTSRFVLRYGWIALPFLLGSAGGLGFVRSQPKLAYKMDSFVLHVRERTV